MTTNTKVPVNAVLDLAKKHGLNVDESLGGWYKVYTTNRGSSGPRCYPAKGKLLCGRIDISCHTPSVPGCIVHPKPPTKKVTHMVDMSQPPEQVLATLDLLFGELAALLPIASSEPVQLPPKETLEVTEDTLIAVS